MRKILLLFIILIPSVFYAQQECAYELEEAQEMFNAGLIENIPAKLEGCLKNGFTKEGHLREHYFRKQIPEDSIVYSLLASEHQK